MKGTKRTTKVCVTCGRDFLIAAKFAAKYTTCSQECSSVRREKARRIHAAEIVCERCGKTVPRTTYQQRFCSNECRLVALNELPRRRAEGPFSRVITRRGYARVSVWDGDTKRTVMEHRLVMEQHLGRRLTVLERVHHINGDRLDNRIENLRLYASQADHVRAEHPELAGNLRRR